MTSPVIDHALFLRAQILALKRKRGEEQARAQSLDREFSDSSRSISSSSDKMTLAMVTSRDAVFQSSSTQKKHLSSKSLPQLPLPTAFHAPSRRHLARRAASLKHLSRGSMPPPSTARPRSRQSPLASMKEVATAPQRPPTAPQLHTEQEGQHHSPKPPSQPPTLVPRRRCRLPSSGRRPSLVVMQ
eukprot:m.55334 g.55334  ORF g.55334 m.55334 type:complete len:186 (+) comp11481_c0_seq2:764-1321(+)